MSRTLAGIALPLLLIVAGLSVARAQIPPVEMQIQDHLQWLSTYDNFRARVVVSDGVNIITGTLLYDTQSRQTVLLMHHDGLSRNLHIKVTRTAAETGLLAFSLGFSRPDDLPFDIKTFGFNPFGGGIPDLFVRGDGLDATMERIRKISDEIALETPALGTIKGVRITLKKTLFDSLMRATDEMLAGENRSPVLPPDYITLWFEKDGGLAAVTLTRADNSLNLEMRFEYEEKNIDAAAFAQLVAQAPPAARYASPAGPDQLAMADNVIEPMLDNWALMVLSAMTMGVSLGLVIRLRGTSAFTRRTRRSRARESVEPLRVGGDAGNDCRRRGVQ